MYIDIFRILSEKNITFNTVETSVAGGSLCSPELYKDMTEKLGVKRAAVCIDHILIVSSKIQPIFCFAVGVWLDRKRTCLFHYWTQ